MDPWQPSGGKQPFQMFNIDFKVTLGYYDSNVRHLLYNVRRKESKIDTGTALDSDLDMTQKALDRHNTCKMASAGQWMIQMAEDAEIRPHL
ncbi:hypothetical protein Tco_0319232 [Tanacetum coccineum]